MVPFECCKKVYLKGENERLQFHFSSEGVNGKVKGSGAGLKIEVSNAGNLVTEFVLDVLSRNQ